jgi:hypothetical protein
VTRRPWSDDEIAYLRRTYPRYGPKHCADKLNRTPGSVQQKATQLGYASGLPLHHVPLAWIASNVSGVIPKHILHRAEQDGVLSDTPGRFYRYTVPERYARQLEAEMDAQRHAEDTRRDWLTVKQIAEAASIKTRTLQRQITDDKQLGKLLNRIDSYRATTAGRPRRYHPTQAREAIADYRKQPKYDRRRSQRILQTLQTVENATVHELARELRANYGTVYATLRNLEHKNLVTRRRAPVGMDTKPPDLWEAA